MYDYTKLNSLLNDRHLTKQDLNKTLSISSKTLAKINKNKKISNIVLSKIANYLECSILDLYEIKSSNILLQQLRDEKQNKISNGIYHELQVRMTYNSNHIEGSTLTEDQTRLIFETNTIDCDNVLVDDIIETVNHFRAIDYVIDIAEIELNEEIIKHLHFLLKQSTKDSTLEWFNVGEYKQKANFVGGMQTTSPSNVSYAIKNLLNNYNNKQDVSINDIIEFHYNFETIHPFQDGNGRVGRLIALKECLRFNLVPFIIEDSKKLFYYRGLKEWTNEKGYLIDTCLDGQDTFKALLQYLDIKY